MRGKIIAKLDQQLNCIYVRSICLDTYIDPIIISYNYAYIIGTLQKIFFTVSGTKSWNPKNALVMDLER